MKKVKIINIITIIVFVVFFIRVFVDMIDCINMKYPQPVLGIEASNWCDRFLVDLAFIIIMWGIPLLINIVVFIISKKKISRYYQ